MKIVLIEPRQGKKNVYSKIPMPLLGLIYLGTILKNNGHQVEIYNEDIHMPDYSKIEADLIGISILTVTAKRGYEIAGMFPKEKVIIGGIHASLLPEEAIQYARQVVIGEAENVILDIVEGRLTDPIVKGTPVEDLDRLPYPDFSLIKGYKQSSMITPISTSRGCPYDCSFCTVTKLFGRKYRFRTADNVIGEIKSKKARRLFFCDDNFTANPKRTDLLFDLLKKNNIKKWACQVRCDIAKDEELLKKMRNSGCDVVCVGFESINPKTLEAFNKHQSVDEIINAIRSFHRNKIKIHGMFVFGSDHDNQTTIWETLRFALKQGIDTIQMMILTPFPGTQVHDKLKKEKRIFSIDWNLYDGQNIVFKPLLLSATELQTNVVNAYSKFYSFSRIITLFATFKFRNALFNIMGWTIFREWKKLHIKHQQNISH
ncbi:MAG: radical SAM protein [Candidatus Auribacterota bacterium]|jgi:radical SAM superfamily enzyme YgiQ (UPF0313 family)|nr:radical SAM protein [Candidatus Auribacterota bacterium]